MCIGIPMQVVCSEAHHAWCESEGQHERLDMTLVGPQPAGTWVLALQGAARQVLSAQAAAQTLDGRRALAAVLAGAQDIDAYFADLLAREPELPPHLQAAARDLR